MFEAFSIAGSRRKLKWLRREVRGRLLARNLKKVPCKFNPAGGIQVIGNTDRTNGLARSYRYEIARLAALGGNPMSSSPEAAANFLILAQPKDYHRLLAQPPQGFREGYRIGFLVTEFETPPQGWDFIFDIVHEIWTPSVFCANALSQPSGVPVKVVPYAVSVPDVTPMRRQRFGIYEGQFLGMAIMDLSSCPERKDPLAHVKAWKLAFGGDPAAHLLMKVRFTRHTAFARKELIKAIDGARNISLVEDEFTDADMCAFQKMADVYLSLHRAEGYGLNIHEMLEIGTPVIATGWSGNMDFMPRYPIATAVPFKLVPYRDRTFQFQGKGLYWAEADIEAAADALESVKMRWDAGNAAMARRKAFGVAGSRIHAEVAA
jgi:glycosyltransferase involved in cell wall biosynthesis